MARLGRLVVVGYRQDWQGSSDPTKHVPEHNDLARAINYRRKSHKENGLQAAINEAISSRRPLEIEPGFYELSAQLVIDGFRRTGRTDLHIFAYDAVFTNDTETDSLLEIKDCKGVKWHGGRFNPAFVCQHTVYIYGDETGSSRIHLTDAVIEGQGVIGLRIGRPDSTMACDQNVITWCKFIGGYVAGEQEVYGQYGAYIGADIFSNCLNHAIDNCEFSGSAINIHVGHTHRMSIRDTDFNSAGLMDIQAVSRNLIIDGVRSENAPAFLKTVGNGSAIYTGLIQGVMYNAGQLNADGIWLKWDFAGGIGLTGCNVLNPPQGVTPVEKYNPTHGLEVMRRLVYGSSVDANEDVTVL